MQFPTVHLNGTSADSLLSDFRSVLDTLSDAIDAVRHCGPNGRDYYVAGDEAFTAARAEHSARLETLVTMRRDYMKLAEHVAN